MVVVITPTVQPAARRWLRANSSAAVTTVNAIIGQKSKAYCTARKICRAHSWVTVYSSGRAPEAGVEVQQRLPRGGDQGGDRGEEDEADRAPGQRDPALREGVGHPRDDAVLRRARCSRRTTMLFETGVLDTLATESSGTSTLVSGKYAAAQPRAVA